MIVDSHAHAWPRWPYQPPVPDDLTRGSFEQLLFEMDVNGVDQSLVVAAKIDRNNDNNGYVADAVRRHRDRLHHVADVDSRWSPTYHAAGADERLRQLVDTYEVVGVTHYLNADNDGWLASDEARRFFEVAVAHDLIVSLAVPPAWQADLRAVARAHPATPFLCHHIAGVHRWAGGAAEARALVVAPAADIPNMYVKLSGYYSGSSRPWDYPHFDVLEVVQAYYDCWGPHRMLWASDHPVAQRKGLTYRQTIEIIRDRCTFIDAASMTAVMGGNLAALLAKRNRTAITKQGTEEP